MQFSWFASSTLLSLCGRCLCVSLICSLHGGDGRTAERGSVRNYQQEPIPFSILVCITFESEPAERQQPQTNNTLFCLK